MTDQDLIERLNILAGHYGAGSLGRNTCEAAAKRIEAGLYDALDELLSQIHGCDLRMSVDTTAAKTALAKASADTHPKGGDVKQAPLVSGAVPEGQTPKAQRHD